MIEAYYIQTAFVALALYADEVPGIDVVAVLGTVFAGIANADDFGHVAVVPLELSEEYAAALMRIGFLAVLAKILKQR
jgi:hypothetical protein